MAKESGIGNSMYIGGLDISAECRNFDIGSPVQTLDFTSIQEAAFERGFGQRAGTVKNTTHFDPLSLGYLGLSLLPTADAVITMPHRMLVGAPAMSMVVKQIGYDPTRDDKGQVLFDVEAQSDNSFADWGVMATAGKRVDTAATNGAAVDHGAVPLGSFGLQAYLQVFAFTGTNVTVKLQQSSDDAVGDPYADVVGGSFGALTTAPQSIRLATARNQAVERYVRVVTSGTFTSVTFAVAVVVNDVLVNL